jgi:hypothetical protein
MKRRKEAIGQVTGSCQENEGGGAIAPKLIALVHCDGKRKTRRKEYGNEALKYIRGVSIEGIRRLLQRKGRRPWTELHLGSLPQMLQHYPSLRPPRPPYWLSDGQSTAPASDKGSTDGYVVRPSITADYRAIEGLTSAETEGDRFAMIIRAVCGLVMRK